jgi:hypothetical protein
MVTRILNLVLALFFFLMTIWPESWWGPTSPHPYTPLPWTVRTIFFSLLICAWVVSAILFFFRSRLGWLGSLVGVGMTVIFLAWVIAIIFRECFFPDAQAVQDRQQLIGGTASEVILYLLGFGFFGVCLASTAVLFISLLKMRRHLRRI